MIDATMNAAMRTFLHDLNENGRGAEARTPGQSIEPGRALSRAHEEATRAGAPVQAAGYVRTPIGCYGSEDAKGRPLCDGPDVRHVRVQVPDGSTFTTLWCEDCRADATCDGVLVIVDEQPATEYYARLARAIALLGDPEIEHALAPHREALGHDAEAEVAEPPRRSVH